MSSLLRVRAVSYLNTSPLVWGFLHGPQQGLFDLRGSLPSACAAALRTNAADIGLVPVIELARQPDLLALGGCSIACRGPVRSILLVSAKPLDQVETIAADTGSRTSVAMTQVVLHERFGRRPTMLEHEPELGPMLAAADAALVIGDPALRIDPAMTRWQGRPVEVHDMGSAWVESTGLPMVFAVWAVKEAVAERASEAPFVASKQYGLARLPEIVEAESARLDLDPALVESYLSRNIVYDLGESETQGMRRFLEAARRLGLAPGDGRPRFADAPALAANTERSL
ncbi:MAG: hypothetical protein GC160_22660 [Acidobacteria bacterium]|nr:hypothetical protein [Acidobacteriota bacterium]